MRFVPVLACFLLSACAGTLHPDARGTGALRVEVLEAPRAITIAGKQRLVYELVVTNDGPGAAKLTRVRVDAGAFAQVRYEGDPLGARTLLVPTEDLERAADFLRAGRDALVDGRKLGATRIIPAGRQALVYLWLEGSGAPSQIVHHAVEVERAGRTRTLSLDAKVEAGVPAFGAPFSSGRWLACNGPSDASAHRRVVLRLAGHPYLAERFAIDWAMIGEDGRVMRLGGDGSNASFHGYGQPVLAIGDARVVKIIDGIPENDARMPTHAVPITLDTVAGNAVILDLGGSLYTLYAHLQPGSIRVKEGQAVRQGEVLGLLGNSGNSSGPHLHLQLCNAPSALACQGLPASFLRLVRQPMRVEGESLEAFHALPAGAPSSAVEESVGQDEIVEFRDLPSAPSR